MRLPAGMAVSLVALLHLGFLVLEMFLWSKPIGRKIFGLPKEVMTGAAPLAANQGLYNGFLAAGLVWGLLAEDPVGRQVTVFFLLCVAVAGVYGSLTASRRILFVQTLPAVLALVALLAS